MDPIEKVIALFHNSIEVRANLGEQLAPLLVDASELLVSTFVNDGRVLLCGYGNSAVNAQHTATLLLNQGDRERPGLPAQLLDANAATITAISESYGANDIFSRQISALGQQGDLLVIYTTTGNPQSLINAVQAAHDRDMRVLLFSGSDGGHAAQLLDGNDLEICIPVEPEFLIHEMHLLLSFIVCDLIDDRLFGGEN